MRKKPSKGISSKSQELGTLKIETFLETTISDETAYCSSTLTRSKSIFIERNKIFKADHLLGKGKFGTVNRFVSPDCSTNYARKKIDVKSVNQNELEIELRLFEKVYNKLGCPFFEIEYNSFHKLKIFLKKSSSENIFTAIMPEIPGMSLAKMIKNKTYTKEIENKIFYSIFRSLWLLHTKLNIAHRDLHKGNIQVLDNRYNVFFIDYGWAFECTSVDSYPLFLEGVLKDLVTVIYDLFGCRIENDMSTKDISFNKIYNSHSLNHWGKFFKRNEFKKELAKKTERFFRKNGMPQSELKVFLNG